MTERVEWPERPFLVCCVEEPSAKEMFLGILPRLGLQVSQDFQVITFEGKQDLEKRLPIRLKAWQRPNSVFLILRDQDSGDCYMVKQALLDKLLASGHKGLVRIACRELETFYLGDLQAVATAMGMPQLMKQQNNRKFRTSDNLNNAKQELMNLTKNQYQEVAGSRVIAPLLNLNLESPTNRSKSFYHLINGIISLVSEGGACIQNNMH